MKRYLSLFMVAFALFATCSFALVTPASAADELTVSGEWIINEVPAVPSTTLNQEVAVTIDGETYDLIMFSTDGSLRAVRYEDSVNKLLYVNVSSWSAESYRTWDFGTEAQSVSSSFYDWLTANGAPVPVEPVDPPYYAVYDLIANAFYGENELTGSQELVITTLATAACVFMFALPFLIVFFLIKAMCAGL